MSASRRQFGYHDRQQRVGPCQLIRRTRRLLAVIRIDDARLLTFAADGPGKKRGQATGSFYGDSFVKPFLVVRAAMFARMPVLLDRSIWQI